MAKGLYFEPCMLKRIMLSAYLLAFLLLLQGVGWFIAWKIAEADAKLVAFHTMNSKGSQMFVFRLSLFDFEKQRIDEREIRINGGLYDIKSCTALKDSVELLVYHDKHEEQLLRYLSKWMGQTPGSQPEPYAQLLGKWLQSVFVVPAALLLPHWEQPSRQDHFIITSRPLIFAAAPHAPPPKPNWYKF